MAEALYRKYRSKTLDEIVGQQHITTTLKNALKSGKISHAYLFTGPRGVGKTSVARILAHEVNGFAYDGSNHIDIIEIDAASNRRIDEIRELRDKVHIAPTAGKYKIYIIDEVHMLTKEAFNALLKTLEEPPEHVIFILATTEAYKLPETIISRTQRFVFKPITTTDDVAHLKKLAKTENIKIDDDALILISNHSRGSFRDSIGMLDQAASFGKHITKSDVEQLLGIAPDEAIADLTATLASGNPKELLQLIEQFNDRGYQPEQIAHQLSDKLKNSIINNETLMGRDETLELLEKLVYISTSPDPSASLELLFLGIVLDRTPDTFKPQQKLNTEDKPKNPLPPETKSSSPIKPFKKTPNSKNKLDDSQWQAILESIKKTHNTLYSIIRMAKPSLNGNDIILSFAFPFHQKQMNEPKNKQLIQDVIMSTMGKNYVVICVVDKNLTQKPWTNEFSDSSLDLDPPSPKSDTLEEITGIFGGGEVLESS